MTLASFNLKAQDGDEQSAEDRQLAEYVSGIVGSTESVSVLLVGKGVTTEMLDAENFKDQFKRLDEQVGFIVVHSESLVEALAQLTSKKILVDAKSPKNGEDSPSSIKLNWLIVQAEGSKLIRVTGSNSMESLLKPR